MTWTEMKAATMIFLHYGNSSHLQQPPPETLPALIPSASPSKRPGAQHRLLQAPRRPMFNYPEWSLSQYPPTQAPTPKIQAEANEANSQGRLMILDSALAAS
jgi:hypothetical protein